MDRRLAHTGRAGMVLVAWVLVAHFATGSSLLHGLVDHDGDPAGQGSLVSMPITSNHAVVGCSDGGACALADRPPSLVSLVPGLALAVVLAVLSLMVVTLVTGRLRRAEPGPAPPPHLSAQVVLVI